jgi:hypothetical protein
LWLEFSSAPQNPQDGYFARVLRNAPDPLILESGQPIPEVAEPPLALDPELVRKVVPDESDDRGGLEAMQPLIASNSPLHFALPLPPGMSDNSPELFGFFTYAQAEQVDGTGRRNVLLSRKPAFVQRSTIPGSRTDAFGETLFLGTDSRSGDLLTITTPWRRLGRCG